MNISNLEVIKKLFADKKLKKQIPTSKISIPKTSTSKTSTSKISIPKTSTSSAIIPNSLLDVSVQLKATELLNKMKITQIILEYPILKLFDDLKYIKKDETYASKLTQNLSDKINKLDESLIINGPISYYYYEWKKKKILLFGDNHSKYRLIHETLKENDFIILINEFIRIAKNKNMCIDFFLEGQISNQKYFNIFNSKNILDKVITQILITNLTTLFKNKLISFDDYNEIIKLDNNNIKERLDIIYLSIDSDLYNKLDIIKEKEIHELLLINLRNKLKEPEYSENNNFRLHGWEISQILIDKENAYFSILFENNTYNNKIDECDYELIYNYYCNNLDNIYTIPFNKYIITNYKDYDTEIIIYMESKIASIIHKQLLKIDNEYFNHIQLKNYFLNVSHFNIRTKILETYSIARMFCKFDTTKLQKCLASDPDNIIYFGGNIHVLNICNFFKYLENCEIKLNFPYYDKKLVDYNASTNHFIEFPLKNYFNMFDYADLYNFYEIFKKT